jgi:hypothetical protein
MSDVGRYRKLYARLWRHPGFVALTEGEKVLALYVLTGPQSNRLGLYVLSIATAAEDLGTTPETLKKRLLNVCQTFGWWFDGAARVVYIPSWFRWNVPENPNVMKGSMKDLNEIPPCGLVDKFGRNIETLPETLHETFLEGLRQRLPHGSPNQEQYPESVSESGKQEPAALRAVMAVKGRKGKPNNAPEVDSRVVRIAEDVIRDGPRQAETEYLIDALQHTCRQRGIEITRAQAIVALTTSQQGMSA